MPSQQVDPTDRRRSPMSRTAAGTRKAPEKRLPVRTPPHGNEYRPSHPEPPIRYDASEWHPLTWAAAAPFEFVERAEPMELSQCPMPSPGRRRP